MRLLRRVHQYEPDTRHTLGLTSEDAVDAASLQHPKPVLKIRVFLYPPYAADAVDAAPLKPPIQLTMHHSIPHAAVGKYG